MDANCLFVWSAVCSSIDFKGGKYYKRYKLIHTEEEAP